MPKILIDSVQDDGRAAHLCLAGGGVGDVVEPGVEDVEEVLDQPAGERLAHQAVVVIREHPEGGGGVEVGVRARLNIDESFFFWFPLGCFKKNGPLQYSKSTC